MGYHRLKMFPCNSSSEQPVLSKNCRVWSSKKLSCLRSRLVRVVTASSVASSLLNNMNQSIVIKFQNLEELADCESTFFLNCDQLLATAALKNNKNNSKMVGSDILGPECEPLESRNKTKVNGNEQLKQTYSKKSRTNYKKNVNEKELDPDEACKIASKRAGPQSTAAARMSQVSSANDAAPSSLQYPEQYGKAVDIQANNKPGIIPTTLVTPHHVLNKPELTASGIYPGGLSAPPFLFYPYPYPVQQRPPALPPPPPPLAYPPQPIIIPPSQNHNSYYQWVIAALVLSGLAVITGTGTWFYLRRRKHRQQKGVANELSLIEHPFLLPPTALSPPQQTVENFAIVGFVPMTEEQF